MTEADSPDADDIASAERVLGVTYTASERVQMLGNINAQIERAVRRRAVAMADDEPPATRFDPRLPGHALPPVEPFRPPPLTTPPFPDDAETIAFAPVHILGAWIRDGALSSVRLTKLYLERIERQAALLCFARITADLALRQAEAADRALADGRYVGPLHGIPWGCKDIIDTAGIATDYGAEPFIGRLPQRDASVVTRLHRAGAVLLGKTSVGALADGDIWHGGRTRNPWNPDEGSSGSSAGSAAAVAAGLVAFALGTETMGSIVAPSVRCGTTGLRPSFGRVPRTGVMTLCPTLDKVGVIAREVTDTALVLSTLAGMDPGDPASIDVPFGWDAARSVSGLRIGWFPAAADPPPALEVVQALGMIPIALDLPDLPYDSLLNLLDAEAAASFESLTFDDRDDLLTWQAPQAPPNSFRRARFLSAVDHVQLDRLRHLVMRKFAALFQAGRVSVIIGAPLAGSMTVISNFTGHPCLVLRCGFEDLSPRGVPIRPGPTRHVPASIGLWAEPFDEATLLRVGLAFQRAFGVADHRPQLEQII